MNIAVISLKDIIKNIISFILVLAILIVSIKTIKKGEFNFNLENTEENVFIGMINSSFLNCLKTALPLITNFEEKSETRKNNTTEIILGTQLAIINSINNREETIDYEEEIVENTNYIDDKENNSKESLISVEDIPDSANTKIISEHNINAKYTDTVDSVQINNQTGFDLKEIIENDNYELKNKNKVIIYHTHTCESYTPSDNFNYEMTGTYRTTDLNFTVSRVGDELEKYLKEYGKNVIHDKTYHDYPAYNGSYGRSLKTMQGILEYNKDAEIMIDLHRDAVRKYRYIWPYSKNRR